MLREKITKAKWLEVNGFSEDGETYIVMGASYSIKDQLKEAGFIYSPLLKWHCGNRNFELPETNHYFTLSFNDIFTWDDEEGVAFLKEGSRDFLENLFNPPRVSKSEYQGEKGQRVTLNECDIIQVGGYAGFYGYTWIYTFKDQNENEYSWFTTANKCLAAGMKCNVEGTIKDFAEYKGVKTTVLTRCKIEVLN